MPRISGRQAQLIAGVEDYVSGGALPAERMIRDVVDCEHSYINTDHPAFIGGSRAIAQVLACQPPLSCFTMGACMTSCRVRSHPAAGQWE